MRRSWLAAPTVVALASVAWGTAPAVQRATPPTSIVHGELDTLTPLAGLRRYCAALTELGQPCEVHVYPGLGHLLTRQLADRERDYDPDPEARADGIAGPSGDATPGRRSASE
ncbi:MAG: prolyl oligopeptidase family serine peptidase [Candidatus Eiseniibacteriota bacterium]